MTNGLYQLLKPFCGYKTSDGQDLSKPWRYKDHIYASDGGIVVRVKAPDYWALSPKAIPMDGFDFSIPPMHEIVNLDFPQQWRNKIVPSLKPEDGNGLKTHPVCVRNRLIRAEYIALINTLPKARFHLPAFYFTDQKPTFFEFNCGEGLVMPLHPKGESEKDRIPLIETPFE